MELYHSLIEKKNSIPHAFGLKQSLLLRDRRITIFSLNQVSHKIMQNIIALRDLKLFQKKSKQKARIISRLWIF